MIPLADRVVELTPHRKSDTSPPERIVLAQGVQLFEQGDEGDRVFVVEDGEIELFRTRIDGTEELLAISRDGDYFGELAPMFGLRRAATARARIDTVVTSYSVRDFRSQLAPGSLADVLNHASDAVEVPAAAE
jgi:CRP-like cAMP-binding protein